MKSPHDIIIRPVLTEKSYDHFADKTYTFVVDKRANKTEIRQAIEAVFGVKVDSVQHREPHGQDEEAGPARRPPSFHQEGLCEAEEGFQGY